jgi:TolB protein
VNTTSTRRALSFALAALLAFVASLLAASPQGTQGSHPGDNGRIAFETDYTGLGHFEIVSVTSSGNDPWNLTNSDPGDYMPAYSPDGSRVAFASARDGISGGWEIYVANADGSGQTRLTTGGAIDTRPAWSPDGTEIAFMSNRGGGCTDYWDPGCNYDIYVMTAEGHDVTQLTNDPDNDAMPAWSPDGSKIAFASGRDGNNEIYVMNADGTGQTRLTNDPDFDSKPDWAPNGNRIAWDSDRDGDFEIFAMDPDGLNVTQLTDNLDDDGYPAYSPDGTRIAFNSDRDGDYDIWTMDADGADPVQVRNDPHASFAPAWQPVLLLRWGDLNCDGVVDALDALTGFRWQAGLAIEQRPGCWAIDEPGETSPGDVNCDGVIDERDWLLILRYAAVLATQTPVGCHVIGEVLNPPEP